MKRAARAQLAVANGVRINVVVGRSIRSFDFLNSIPSEWVAAREVDRPFEGARFDVCRREKTRLSTDVDKLVRNSAESLLVSMGGSRALGDGLLTSLEGEKWKVCGRGLRIGYETLWDR
jgi:hypothetical protein